MINIQDLKEKQNQFGKLIAKVEGWDDKITTYGYIRHVNSQFITFEDSADPKLRFRVHSIESFEIENLRTRVNKFV
jgi:hypothetical protein